MKRIGLVVNREKDPDLRIAGQICDFFQKKNIDCSICELIDQKKRNKMGCRYTDTEAFPADMDCVITLGGDGTLLQAARDLRKQDIPILGVNLGHLGFLAELEASHLPNALEPLVCDEYMIEHHMMIEGQVLRQGKVIFQDIALNDIVLASYGHSHIISFDVNVDNHYLMSYKADGLIVATPTGSTAYNLSAGGPLIMPTANLMALTPICAHTLNTRSVILPPESVVEIEVKDSISDQEQTDGCAVTFDGDSMLKLLDGDRIRIVRSHHDTKLVKLRSMSFIEMLRNKMQ